MHPDIEKEDRVLHNILEAIQLLRNAVPSAVGLRDGRLAFALVREADRLSNLVDLVFEIKTRRNDPP